MTQNQLPRGLRMVGLLSVTIALFSLRYSAIPWHVWPDTDPLIRAANFTMPLPLFFHAMFASIALAVGPFQFVPGLRARRPRLHRYLGRLYVLACLIGGAAAIVVARHAAGGAIAGLGFTTLAVLWTSTTAAAGIAAMNGNFDRHRMLMRYSFAMTFAAVTLRLQAPIGLALLGFHSYAEMSPWLAYTSWIPNLAAVWIYGIVSRGRGIAPQVSAAAA